MKMTIAERAWRLIERHCPPAIEGQGGHGATYRVACVLVHGFGLSPEEAMPLMLEYNATCQPPWSQHELWHKLRSALHGRHRDPRGHLLEGDRPERGELPAYEAPKKKEAVKFDLEALKRAQRPGLQVTDAWLRERSVYDPRGLEAGQVLDLLYGPEEKVMVFGSMKSVGDWMRWRGGWYELGKTPEVKARRVRSVPERTKEGMVWLIQPVDGLWHAKRGETRLSRRTGRSVVRWPYLLLESDEAPADLWLNMLVCTRLPVVAIVTSGGRSVHALVRVNADTEELWRSCVEAVRDTLAALGCDRQALSNPMVNMRLPNVLREGKMVGKRDAAGQVMRDARGQTLTELRPYGGGPQKQRLLYLNPEARGGAGGGGDAGADAWE